MFDWAFVRSILPQMGNALGVTFQATVAGFALATLLGLLIAVGRRSSVRVLAALLTGFVEFVRSTPLLVQVDFSSSVLPRFGVSLTPLAAGIIGLGVHYSTYLSEVYRGGIESSPRGQWEAAVALAFSAYQTWTKIILPQ